MMDGMLRENNNGSKFHNAAWDSRNSPAPARESHTFTTLFAWHWFLLLEELLIGRLLFTETESNRTEKTMIPFNPFVFYSELSTLWFLPMIAY